MNKLLKIIKILILLSFIGLPLTACAGAVAPLDAFGKVQHLQNAG